ncbi:MAG TPA: Wzz/FepE/Etk N-terminal domain-containing protein, partial [Pyrinomonadaceae bacterium]
MKDDFETTKGSQEALDLAAPPPPPLLPQPRSPAYGADADAGDGIHLRDYWRAVYKRLWLVVGVVIFVTLAAALYMARQPDVYVSQARVRVNIESAGPGLARNNQYVIINNPVSDPTYFNTQLQILTSPGLLRRVAKTLDLERNPAFSSPRPAGGQSSWRGVLRAFGLGGAAPRPPAVDDELPPTTPEALSVSHEDLAEAKRLAPYVSALQAGLRVEPVKETRTAGYVKDTRLIDISFRHADPRLAAKVVNTVAQTFVLANLEELTETNTSTGSFLQKRVADLQHQIRADEEQLAKYSREHQIVSLTGDQNIVAE